MSTAQNFKIKFSTEGVRTIITLPSWITVNDYVTLLLIASLKFIKTIENFTTYMLDFSFLQLSITYLG